MPRRFRDLRILKEEVSATARSVMPFFYRGKEVAVVGNGEFALHEAEELRNVTQDVTIYTDGKEPEFSREHPIAVNTMKIQAIEGDDKVSGLLMQSDTAAQDAEAPESSFLSCGRCLCGTRYGRKHRDCQTDGSRDHR